MRRGPSVVNMAQAEDVDLVGSQDDRYSTFDLFPEYVPEIMPQLTDFQVGPPRNIVSPCLDCWMC